MSSVRNFSGGVSGDFGIVERCGEYRPSGSFDCADHDKAVICFAQDDGIIG